MDQSQELFVKMIMLSWEAQNSRTTKLFNTLTDDQFLLEVSPGRNRGIYLLGHLIAVNDSLAVTLGLGERLFSQYEDIFLEKPDKSGMEMPDIDTLKQNWNQGTQQLKDYFKKMTAGDWFLKHTTISEADFAKEPHRNKLNVQITRINHEAYHQGQLTLLQKK